MAGIPLVDLNSHEAPDVSRAMRDLGFLTVKSPWTPSREQIENVFEISKQFFLEEPLENKERVSISVENKGWVKMRQESYADPINIFQ